MCSSIPGTLIALVCLHLLMVLQARHQRMADARPAGAARHLRARLPRADARRDGAPFVPYAVWKDLFFAAFILLAVGGCAWYFGPFGPSGRPDPTIIQTVPKPDYFFLWLYALLSLLPPSLETPALLIGPVVAIAALLLLPFLSGEGEKSWKRRPIAVLTVLLIAITLGTFTHLADLRAVESAHERVERRSRAGACCSAARPHCERQGALVFQAKQCRNCHALGEQRRRARARARRRRRAPHAGSTHSPGDSGRRQHARLRKEPESGGNDGAGGVSRDAASAKSTTGARSHSRSDEMILVFVLLALVYMRGWLRLRSSSAPAAPGAWRAASFLVGVFLVWGALGSPLVAHDRHLLTVHMIQHLLLMTVAPPLILLGEPHLAFWHGLPRVGRILLGWALQRSIVQRFARTLSRPTLCWTVSALTLVGWHVPALFTLALRSEVWHSLEQSSFLGAGFLFWWPVVQPWPSLSTLSVPVPGDAAMRRPVGVPRVFRADRLPRVLVRASARKCFRAR